MERTSVIKGSTPVLIVAPHGPDDENTALLTEMVASNFGAYAVINRGWERSSKVDQMADLANCNNVRHLYEDVVREEFLLPILRCRAEIARKYTEKMYMFVIHGCKDNLKTNPGEDMLDLIVGYGAGNPPSYSCKLRSKNVFIKCLQEEGFGVYEGAAGGMYAGKSKNNLNQLFVRWKPDHDVESMQLEIVRELRMDKSMTALTADGIMAALDAFMLNDSDEVDNMKVGKI